MAKSPDAFRTISEVADWLGIQAHVLRFWESKFSQVKPVKRAGGRRYYRPNDMLLLGGIKQLLHEDGLTIKGVQKILREEGMSHVVALSQPLDDLTQSQLDEETQDSQIIDVPADPEETTGVVLSFDPSAGKPSEAEVSATPPPPEQDQAEAAAPAPQEPKEETPPEQVAAPPEAARQASPEPDPTPAVSAPPQAAEVSPEESLDDAPGEDEDEDTQVDAANLPAFLRRRPSPASSSENEPPASAPTAAEPEPTAPPPKPRVIDVPPLPALETIPASAGVMTAAHCAKHLTRDQADQIAPLLTQLTALRDSMVAKRRPVSNTGAND